MIYMKSLNVRKRVHEEEIAKKLEASYGKAGSPKKELFQKIGEIYEHILSGDIKSWKIFDWHKTGFFSHPLNLEAVIRYATLNHLLEYFGCSLQNLPVQRNFSVALERFRLNYINMGHGAGVRNFFLLGFPEMKNSIHWHPSRWSHHKDSLVAQRYSDFRRKYLFEVRLNCKTKHDVISAMNDEERFFCMVEDENLRIARDKMLLFPTKKSRVKSPYRYVEDLKGDIYDIDPWELKYVIPSSFGKIDGRHKKDIYNKDTIARYLAWADRNYGVPFNVLSPRIKIPHYQSIVQNSGLSADELRKLVPDLSKPWDIDEKSHRNVWKNPDGSLKMENVNGVIEWAYWEYGWGCISTRELINNRHLRSMYNVTGLRVGEIRKIYNEVKVAATYKS